MDKYTELILPCAAKEFISCIDSGCSYQQIPLPGYMPVYRAILKATNNSTAEALYMTSDASVIVYDFTNMCLIYTTVSDKIIERWLLKASIQSIDSFISGRSSSFFVPFKFLNSLPLKQSSTHIEDCEDLDTSYTSTYGYVGRIECYEFEGATIMVYDQLLAQVKDCTNLMANNFRIYLNNQLAGV